MLTPEQFRNEFARFKISVKHRIKDYTTDGKYMDSPITGISGFYKLIGELDGLSTIDHGGGVISDKEYYELNDVLEAAIRDCETRMDIRLNIPRKLMAGWPL